MTIILIIVSLLWNIVKCEYLILGGIQGQVGWSPGQSDVVPDLLAGNPAHGSRSGTR